MEDALYTINQDDNTYQAEFQSEIMKRDIFNFQIGSLYTKTNLARA